MTNKDTFSSYHPIINFLYFALALAFSMFFTHPVCLVISLACAITYSVYLNGKKAQKFSLIFLLPMILVAALINPAFNHQGGTILTYLPSGNPLTLESVAYGVAAGAYPISLFAVYFALCIMPFVLNVREDLRWIAIESKI